MAFSSTVSSITLGGTLVPAVGSVSISIQRQQNDVTYIGSYNTISLPGVQATGLSVDVFYAYTDHAAFFTNLVNANAAVAFVLTIGSGDTISGTAYVVGADVSVVTGDVGRASFTLNCTGPITVVADVAI